MIVTGIDVLIRLLIAHLLSDFIFQPASWVDDRMEKKWKSRKLYIHTFITFILTYLALYRWELVWFALAITALHFLADIGKACLLPKAKLKFSSWKHIDLHFFLGDQAIHLLTIIAYWFFFCNQNKILTDGVFSQIQNTEVLLILGSYLLVTIPYSVLIENLTSFWNDQIQQHKTLKSESLKDAGKWIGIIERILILTFTLLGQYAPIGFILAAKSIFRFGDLTKSKDHMRTEYVMIGTLLSFTLAIITGLAIRQFL